MVGIILPVTIVGDRDREGRNFCSTGEVAREGVPWVHHPFIASMGPSRRRADDADSDLPQRTWMVPVSRMSVEERPT